MAVNVEKYLKAAFFIMCLSNSFSFKTSVFYLTLKTSYD